MKLITKKEAKQFLEHFSVIPINQDKTPAVKTWIPYKAKKIDAATLERQHTGRLALICGYEGLEVIDVDLKHIKNDDGTPDHEGQKKYWQRFLSLLEDGIDNFKDNFAIYSTVNKGYHILYRYEIEEEKREGNQDLAKRTFKDIDANGKVKLDANGQIKYTNKALIETRAKGGYVFAYPENKEGKLNYFELKTISLNDRNKVINIARSLNEIKEPPAYKPAPRKPQPQQQGNDEELKPGDDYNNRHDIWHVIKDDFKKVKETAKFTHVLRTNGQTTSKDSGKIFKDKGYLYLHTSNTIYPAGEPLTPFAAYTHKHHAGDFKEAARHLASLGYGKQSGPSDDLNSLLASYSLEDYPHQPEAKQMLPGPTIPAPQDNKEITIVNNPTEAAQATNSGLANVIDLEEKELTKKAIKEALALGYERFNLHLDNDKQDKALSELLKAKVKLTYILNELTPQAATEAPSYYIYKLNTILSKYDKLIANREDKELTYKEIDQLKKEIVTTADTIKDAIDSKQFTNLFLQSKYVKSLGIDDEALNATIKEIRIKREQREALQKLKKLNNEIKEATEKGDLNEAFKKHNEAKLIELDSQAAGFTNLFTNETIDEIRAKLKDRPGNIFTGYTIENTPLSLPAGALTVIAGATGHGKTTYMVNLAINLIKLHEGKKVYFFSYEEDTPALVRNAINVYTAETLSHGNRRTIDSYLRDDTLKYVDEAKRPLFKRKVLEYENEVNNNNRLVIKKVDSFKAEHLCAAIRHLKDNSKDIAAVFVDYIQLIYLEDAKGAYSRQDELKKITDQLKSVANDTGLAIVLGAQFNREVRSVLNLEAIHIREAADIEHSASLVLGVWNNSKNHGYKNLADQDIKKKLPYFTKKGLIPTPEESANYKKGDPSTMYIKILKNRTGIDGLEEAFYWEGNQAIIRNTDALNPNNFKKLLTKEEAKLLEDGHDLNDLLAAQRDKTELDTLPF